MSSTEQRSAPDFAGEDPDLSAPGVVPAARRFGAYLLVEQLGRGGMGEVWLAKQSGLAGIDTLCVVKTVRAGLAQDPEYKGRFVDEARTMVRLTHRNICHVFDVGVVGDDYFFAMEMVAGFDFSRIFREAHLRGARIDEAVAVHLTAEILEALDYAHRLTDVSTGEPLQLVHRDVSLQNALVSLEGEVKLIDFGLAKSRLKQLRTEVGVVHGKMAYMSPEQARGDHVDARTDQFGAAVVCYELLTGERYYGDMAIADITRVIASGTYAAPLLSTLSPEVRGVLTRALSGDRGDRYSSCAVMRKALLAHGAPASSEDVRALLERLFPGAREEHRARMLHAMAAANAAVAVPFERTSVIASAALSSTPTLIHSTIDVAPITEVDGPAPSTDEKRTGSTDPSSDTTQEGEPERHIPDPPRPVPRRPVDAPTLRVTRVQLPEEPRKRRSPIAAVAALAVALVVGVVVARSGGWHLVTTTTSPPATLVVDAALVPDAAPTPPPPPVPAAALAPDAASATPVAPVIVDAPADLAPTPIVEAGGHVPRGHHREPHGVKAPERPAVTTPDAPAPPALPASAPQSVMEMCRVVEASCSGVVPCASQVRARSMQAMQSGNVDAVKAARAAAEQCFAECKRRGR